MAPIYTGVADASGNWSAAVTDELPLGVYSVRARQSRNGVHFGPLSDPFEMSVDPASPISGTPASLYFSFVDGVYFRNGAWVPPASAFDFARGSAGTYFDADGLLQTAGTNVLRFDHDPVTLEPRGALIEGARTNSITRSEAFENAAWTKSRASVTANATVAPDGEMSADKIIASVDLATHRVWNFITKATSALTYTASCFFKAGELPEAQLRVFEAAEANAVNLSVDLGTGATSLGAAGMTVIAYGSIDCGNGWWLVWLTFTTTTNDFLFISPHVGNGAFAGDGTSGVYIWGAQLELGAFRSSCIKTDATAITRAADILTVGPVGSVPFEGWNSTEGTILADVGPIPAGTAAFLWAMGTGSDAIGVRTQSNNRAYVYNLIGGVNNGIDAGPFSSGKVAYAFKSGDSAVAVNGGAAVTSAGTFTLPPATFPFSAGAYLNGGQSIFTTLCSLSYFPKRLSNAELQALTS